MEKGQEVEHGRRRNRLHVDDVFVPKRGGGTLGEKEFVHCFFYREEVVASWEVGHWARSLGISSDDRRQLIPRSDGQFSKL